MIEDQAIVYEVSYPHPPEQVWQALVDSRALAQWLLPNDFAPIAGGHFTMDCDPLGEIAGEVLELDPPRRMSWRWVGVFGDTIVTFDLTPADGGTLLRLEHRGWNATTAAHREHFDSGWPGKLQIGLPKVLTESAAHTPCGEGR